FTFMSYCLLPAHLSSTHFPYTTLFRSVFDRLVFVSSTYRYASTSNLLTSSSLRDLITEVGKSHLEGGFMLRCFQHLSRPYIATQRCRWHDNWYTRGMSIPVLSY